MIPREAKRGNSFKGAGLYYFHDKGALTRERVAFTHTENLPTEDPELATRWMAYTALHADELKRQAGVAQTGRKASKPVFCFSLSWHPEEQPDQAHMIETGRSALATLGLQEHQVVMVSHQDEAYSHLHCLVNLVNPQHGKMHTLQYSRKRLSLWAEAYEREHGKIYCEQRVENNRRRKEGEYVKYQNPELDQKAIITKLYQSADNGQALRAALAEAGYTLAQGNRIVLVDSQGEIHSLARQIDGVSTKELRALLKGLALPDVDEVRKRQEEERGKQAAQPKAGQQDGKPLDRTPDAQQAGHAQPDSTQAYAGAQEQPDKRPATITQGMLASLQNRQRDELLHFSWEEASVARTQLWRSLDRQYGETERRLQAGIADLTQTLKERGRLSQTEADRLDTLRHDLAQIEACQAAATLSLENQLREREEAIKARHAQQWTDIRAGIAPPKTELGGRFEQAAQAPTGPAHPNADRPAPAAQQRQAASARAAEDQELDAFLDRMQGPRGRGAAAGRTLMQRGTLTTEFDTVANTRTPEDAELDSFLDRLQGEEQERDLALLPAPQPLKVEDEYAHSLSAEFDAAGGAPGSEDGARDAFLDRLGGGMGQGISIEME